MKLSLCIPTNGIIEWVFPALDSIYESNVDQNLFEVIVTDNGTNKEFKTKMNDYVKQYQNIIYMETDEVMFDNQLAALKIANGDYLKLVNHRAKWLPGRLQDMIDFIIKYEHEKPVIYFSNGVMGWGPVYREYDSFDAFVSALGIYGTWTTGVGIWKSEYERLKHCFKYDKISPHAGILYADRSNPKYVINDRYWMKEVDTGHEKKGKYNLYKAFALDEFIITINLYRDGSITEDTLIKIKNDFKNFLISLYVEFNIKKKPCSYDLEGFKKYINIFFSEKDIIEAAYAKYNTECLRGDK